MFAEDKVVRLEGYNLLHAAARNRTKFEKPMA
jgi:hypothetical protein